MVNVPRVDEDDVGDGYVDDDVDDNEATSETSPETKASSTGASPGCSGSQCDLGHSAKIHAILFELLPGMALTPPSAHAYCHAGASSVHASWPRKTLPHGANGVAAAFEILSRHPRCLIGHRVCSSVSLREPHRSPPSHIEASRFDRRALTPQGVHAS